MMDIEFFRMERLEDAPGAGRAAKGREVLAVMPCTDRVLAERSARQIAARAMAPGLVLVVEDVGRHGFVAVANHVFRATDSRFFAYVAQDCFAGRRWLQRALHALESRNGGLLGFNDGKWAGLLAAFGIVRRDWAVGNYGGDLFLSGYERHYADAELTMLAMQAGRYSYDPECLLVEVDWDKERSAVNAADRALYRHRAAGGFDGRVEDPKLRSLFS